MPSLEGEVPGYSRGGLRQRKFMSVIWTTCPPWTPTLPLKYQEGFGTRSRQLGNG
jgi:hypothetical protein